VLGYIQF